MAYLIIRKNLGWPPETNKQKEKRLHDEKKEKYQQLLKKWQDLQGIDAKPINGFTIGDAVRPLNILAINEPQNPNFPILRGIKDNLQFLTCQGLLSGRFDITWQTNSPHLPNSLKQDSVYHVIKVARFTWKRIREVEISYDWVFDESMTTRDEYLVTAQIIQLAGLGDKWFCSLFFEQASSPTEKNEAGFIYPAITKFINLHDWLKKHNSPFFPSRKSVW